MSENVRYLLAFDTAGDTVHLGLAAFLPDGRGCAPARVVAIEAPRAANAVLLEAITQVLDAEGIGLSDLAAIAVGCSLGSYTGVRIGVATAKGLAQGLGIGLYGVATGAGELRGGKGADGGEEAVGAEACAAGDTNGQALVDAFVASYAQASGDVAAVLPYYTRLSYAEEAELQRSQIKESQKPVMPGLTRHLKPASQETFEASDGQQSARLRGQKAVPTQGLPSGDSGDVTCRRLTPMDVAALVALAGEVEGFGWSRASLIEELNNPTRLWFGTLRREGEGLWRLIGCVGAADLAGELNVLMLAVASGERRRGVARALLDLLLEQARERRIASATLEVRADNEAAIRLYRSAGFTQTGRRTGYYPQAATPVGTPSAPGGRLASGGQQSAAPRQKAVPMDALLFACSLTLPEFARPLVLGIESSCDETAAAVVAGDALLSNVVASQVQFHARFGGVVPEIASRKHSEAIVSTVDEALRQAASAGETRLSFAAVDAIAVTDRPGLIGALVVGLAYAKGLAAATGKPLYGINHLEGHLYAVLLDTATVPDHRALPVPHVALIVSGGHTSLVYSPASHEYRTLGETLDDATGEAFDKVAKALGLGYPGGPVLSQLATTGNPAAINFPRAMLKSGDYDFSLSGLKTAVMTYIRSEQQAGRELNLPDLAASFQQAIIDVQVSKALRAVQEYAVNDFILAGGVAANAALRKALCSAMSKAGVTTHTPDPAFCGDNAAMIARAATARLTANATGMDALTPLSPSAEATARASLNTAWSSQGLMALIP